MTARISAEASLLERIHLFRTDWQQGHGNLKKFIRECQNLRTVTPQVWTKRVALAYVELLTEIKEQPAPRERHSNADHHRPPARMRGGSSVDGQPSYPMESSKYFDLTKVDCQRPPDTVRNIPEVMEFLSSLRSPSRVPEKRYTDRRSSPQYMLGASRECDSILHDTTFRESSMPINEFDRASVSQQSTRPGSEQGDSAAMHYSPQKITDTPWNSMFGGGGGSTQISPFMVGAHTRQKEDSSAPLGRPLSNEGIPFSTSCQHSSKECPPATLLKNNANCPDAWIPGHQCDDLCNSTLCSLEQQATSRDHQIYATR